MNALSILKHAYETIANSHPEKDAFAIVADIETLVQRIVGAARSLENTVFGAPVQPVASTAPVDELTQA